EIAQALALSHQRVQQMGRGAGGSWWSKVWGARTIKPDAVCTWCGRPPSEVAKLVAGPKVYICDECVASAERAAQGRARPGPFARQTVSRLTQRCGFSGKRGAASQGLIASPAGRICDECLQTCRHIMGA